MKNMNDKSTKMRSILATQIRRICAIAVVAVIGFSMAACGDGSDDGGGGGGTKTFTSVGSMNTWLSEQPDNTATTAYNVKLNDPLLFNLSGKLRSVLISNYTKYVNLDLSGSTGSYVESIPDNTFSGCTNLTSVTIPNSVRSSQVPPAKPGA